jgi:4-phytase/acid phosphatase
MSMTRVDEEAILQFAQLSADAIAMNDAALADDLDEARFRAGLILSAAQGIGLLDVAEAAEDVVVLLRPPGNEPIPGYGHAMLRLAKALSPPSRRTCTTA